MEERVNALTFICNDGRQDAHVQRPANDRA